MSQENRIWFWKTRIQFWKNWISFCKSRILFCITKILQKQNLKSEFRANSALSEGKNWCSEKTEDFELVNFLLEKLNFNTQQTKKYVISFFNAVNLRFRSLTKPSVELYIAGIIVAETKSAFPFISENIEKKNLIDAASTLHDMGRYFYKDRWVPH